MKFEEELQSLPEDAELYFGDESGCEEHYDREYGHSLRGEKVYGEVDGTPHSRTSVVAAYKDDVRKPETSPENKLVAPFAFKGSMNADLFEGWVEHVFVPELTNPSKSWLIIDNARFHKRINLDELAEGYGFHILFLPKYSPDFNPIEHVWANIKNWLRLHMREYGNFWAAFSAAFQSV